MKINTKNIAEIRSGISNLCNRIEYFTEDDFEIELGDESIFIRLPGVDSGESFSIEEFLFFIQEMSNFKVIDNGRIQTKTRTYQIIKAESEDLEYYLKNTSDFFHKKDDIEIRIIEAPIFIGIACTEIEAYHEEFGSDYENLIAIEINYLTNPRVIDETELIYSYLFEIADTTGFIFYLSEIYKRDPELDEKIDEIINRDGLPISDEEMEKFSFKPLLQFNESMKLYASALQTTDPELRLLNFYKILEYFAPIVINIDAYDLLAKKLDSPKVLKPNREYLKSIFDLVNSTNQRFKDNELIKSVFNRCFDLVDTFEYLPESIKSKVLGTIKEKGIDYLTSKDKLSQASNIIATSLYSTRNWVVHAKSNYESTGNECQYKDLKQLNIFLRVVTARTIRWYSKLPDIQK
jgi:hypothetical protein